MFYFLLSTILPLLALAGLSWCFTRQFGVPSYSGPLCAAGTIVTCLYVADFLSLLKATGLLLLVGGNGLLMFYAYRCWKGEVRVGIRRCILAILLLVGLAGLAHLNYRTGFNQWDEFSHWGTFTKLLYSEDTFHLRAMGIRYYFEDYPPGTALFSYFFLQASGYSEPVVYFAHGVILLCGCLPAIGMAMSASTLRGLLAGVACFLFVVVLGQGWSSALIDHIVGILFGGIVCAFWTMRNSAARSLLALIPPLCFLVLSKQSGASFALLVTGLIFVDRFWFAYHVSGWRAKLVAVSPVILIFALPRLVQASWTWHVNHDDLTKTFSATNTGDAFAKLLGCCKSDREIKTVASFFQAMTGLPHAVPSPPGNIVATLIDQASRTEVLTAVWFATGPTHLKIVLLFSVLSVFAVLLRSGSPRLRLALFSAMFVAVGGLYVLSLLVYYVYVFSEYEGRAIASHDRFINTYLIAFGLFAVGALLSAPAINLARRAVVYLSVILVLLLFRTYVPIDLKFYLRNGGPQISQSRSDIRAFLAPILSSQDRHASVYAIWETTSIQQVGLEFWMMHYELRPRNTNLFCFSLGPPQYAGDLWSCKKSEEEVDKEFADYQIVAVGNGLGVLQKQYPRLFAGALAGANSGLFETFRDEEGKVGLRPIESQAGAAAK